MVNYEALYRSMFDLISSMKSFSKVPNAVRRGLKYYINWSYHLTKELKYQKRSAAVAGMVGFLEGEMLYSLPIIIILDKIGLDIRTIANDPLGVTGVLMTIVGVSSAVGLTRGIHSLYEINKKEMGGFSRFV